MSAPFTADCTVFFLGAPRTLEKSRAETLGVVTLAVRPVRGDLVVVREQTYRVVEVVIDADAVRLVVLLHKGDPFQPPSGHGARLVPL